MASLQQDTQATAALNVEARRCHFFRSAHRDTPRILVCNVKVEAPRSMNIRRIIYCGGHIYYNATGYTKLQK
jgi:hypothetical protein